jgi:glycosyltransferase involved in cell wall biosynthesis
MPQLTVVIPLYNKRRYVRRALDSISAQTFNDFELIVVDDGSTDGSGEEVARHPDPRFRVVHQANAGPGAARNRGIAEAAGDLIAFLDADDEWLPEYLQRAVTAMEAHPDIAAFTQSYLIDPGGISSLPIWQRGGVHSGVQRVTSEISGSLLLHMVAFMTCDTTTARRAALERWGGFFARDRCSYGEDEFLFLKLLLNETVRFDLVPGARHHFEAAELSGDFPGPRPIEPFLLHADEIEASCPDQLRRVLGEFLAIRAFKTASWLAVWGRWREARELRRRFWITGGQRLPSYWSALALATPFGAALGPVVRRIRQARKQ